MQGGREASLDQPGFPGGTYGADPAASFPFSSTAGGRPHADISTPSGASASQPVSQVELRIEVTRPEDINRLSDRITEEFNALGINSDQVSKDLLLNTMALGA